MSDVTQILSQIELGDPSATEKLFPIVYEELRKLAAARMAHERADQTLQATALVHEAWIRMAGQESMQQWESRKHFFGAACEAMRRILVDKARSKPAQKRGGYAVRESGDLALLAEDDRPGDVIAIHDSLEELALHNPQAADLVKMRYFGGFSLDEAADILGIGRTTAYRLWSFARAWLRSQMDPWERTTYASYLFSKPWTCVIKRLRFLRLSPHHSVIEQLQPILAAVIQPYPV